MTKKKTEPTPEDTVELIYLRNREEAFRKAQNLLGRALTELAKADKKAALQIARVVASLDEEMTATCRALSAQRKKMCLEDEDECDKPRRRVACDCDDDCDCDC